MRGVQRVVWDRVALTIEEKSGLRIDTEEVALRIFPARLRASGVEVSSDGRTILSLGRVEARWKWHRLASDPRRLELLEVDGVTIDRSALPETSGDQDTEPLAQLSLFEIGELRILGVGIGESAAGIEVVVDGLNIEGSLESGMAKATVWAENLSLGRAGRILDLGRVAIDCRISEERFELEQLDLGSPSAATNIVGELGLGPAGVGHFEVGVEGDLEALAKWWDPNLVTGLEPAGRVDLEGVVSLSGGEVSEVELRHRGSLLRVAGYNLSELELRFSQGVPRIFLSHTDWGRATVAMAAMGVAQISADLDAAPVDRLLGFTAPRVASIVGRPATVSGKIDGTISYPFIPELVGGTVDLDLVSPVVEVALQGEGEGTAWRLQEIDAIAFGLHLTAIGILDEGGSLDFKTLVRAEEPNRVVESLRKWLPELREVTIGGGPIEARAQIGGSLAAPRFSTAIEWLDPVIGGQPAQEIAANASGDLRAVDWSATLAVSPHVQLTASGSARPGDGVVDGVWEVRIEDLQDLLAMLPTRPEAEIAGSFMAGGEMAVDGGRLNVDGVISCPGISYGEWEAGPVRADFSLGEDSIDLRDVTVGLLSGEVEGDLMLPISGTTSPIRLDLEWRNLDLGLIPGEQPEFIAGFLSGGLRAGGSLGSPEGELEVAFRPETGIGVLGEVSFLASLTGGVITAVSQRLETVAGPGLIETSIPLGDLRRPDWLWPQAPGGPVQATLDLPGFESGRLMEALGFDSVPASARADLRTTVLWDPLRPDRPRVLVEADGLRIQHESGALVAEGPLVMSLDDGRIELAPVVLAGPNSRIEASAALEPGSGLVVGRFRAHLDPVIAEILPMPLDVEGPISVDADFEVPADRSVSLEAVQGFLTIDHRGGRMIMRDPPMEIRDLRVVASLDDGVLEITEGGAEVNQGRVYVGGGWDPKSGQGVVIEFDSVTTMVAGILAEWDGDIAVEPHADQLARVSGDLNLVAGLWDERFDLASAMLSGGTGVAPEDDYLHDVGLDLTVRGLAGIRVENNLGRFNVNWDQLRVGGTAAEPVLRGEVRIASGGVLALAGHEVEVRRGIVEFTGNPDIDPLVEIVPASDTTLFGGEEGVGATELATRGLAQGITSALGFENETLRPAEIAVQTETDPSVRFMVGQRLSRRLALFLAANLTDVQDRLTMLQYWNIPGLKGLAFQAYQETADDNIGTNVFQRFEWGGSPKIVGRTEIHRVRLDGEWPMSKRSLRRATRLRRGQPFDPFLLFVGAVRMERLLAEQGWQNARVSGERIGTATAVSLVYTCDPGQRQSVKFEGDPLPDRVRREVTAIYQGGANAERYFDEMVSVVRRHIVSEGFITPQIGIERRGEEIVVDVQRGGKTDFEGPFFDGLPVDAVVPSVRALASPDALALAVDQPQWAAGVVERVMRSAGYFAGRVLEISTQTTDTGSVGVHIAVESGERAVAETVTLVGEDPLGLTAVSAFPIRPGMPLDKPAIDAATREVRRTYVEEGFREASVRSSIKKGSGGLWDVEISVNPGRQRTVREIRFTGRRDVSTKVLLKGVTLESGEVLTDRDLDRSASQIANFSPVERDSVEVVPVGDSEADVEFDVIEKKRWTLEAGGGWSTERGFGAAFGARDDNLFGRGIGLNLRGSLDSVEKRIFLLGSIPPVPGGRLSFISTIGYGTGDAPDDPDFLNQDQKLASLEASYRLPKSVQVGLYYRWTDTRTYEKVPDDFFPLDINVRIGTLGARTVIERFDYLFDPRNGWGLTSDVGWSGEAIGSDLEYVSWLSGFSLALEPFRDATWIQSLRLGVAEALKGTSLDREARYFAGGQSSVRGFDLNSVGPVTFGFDGSLVPAGGGALLILNEELRIPVWDPLRLAVFADIGQVWESWREADGDLSVGVGFGVRWSTPIGPLWADVAWPVANVGISSTKPKFYLGIGRPF
jgi:translocation and assembly module TamA